MRKFIFCILFFLSSLAHADCSSLNAEKLSEFLKKNISGLSWVDINPSNDCQFSIRYYQCNKNIQNQINKILPDAIHKTSDKCTYISQGKHQHTEGYCTLYDVTTQCSAGEVK